MFNQIDEVYTWLYNQRKLQKRKDLERIKRCILDLNLTPTYKICHIAGTNGKGSVAKYIKEILALTNRHVGFFVSPYILSFNERIEINDRYISDAEIMHYANILYDYSNQYYKENNDIIPFFELTLLMALMYFKDRKIDYAVIECGLGGLLDATNALDKELSIITNIGYDHMEQLGNTLEQISMHKLGIVKPNGLLITGVDNELIPLFKDYINKISAKMIHVNPNVSDIKSDIETTFKYKGISYKTNLLGDYQAINASIAIEAVNHIDSTIPYDLINYALSHISWPGRMELVSKEPMILLDGGHNIHAISHTVSYLKEIKGNKKIKVLFTSLQDKDYKSMLTELDKIADYYYFTTLNDLRKSDPSIFKENRLNSEIIDNPDLCLAKAKEELKSDEILFITGSLHFISYIRKKI